MSLRNYQPKIYILVYNLAFVLQILQGDPGRILLHNESHVAEGLGVFLAVALLESGPSAFWDI